MIIESQTRRRFPLDVYTLSLFITKIPCSMFSFSHLVTVKTPSFTSRQTCSSSDESNLEIIRKGLLRVKL